MELEGRRRRTVLYAAPVEVAPLLRELLFGAIPSVVMTSATLAVNGALDYFRGRIGADTCEAVRVGSPFDYARQMRVLIPERMPDPTDTAAYEAAAATAIRFSCAGRGVRPSCCSPARRTMRRVAGASRAAIGDGGPAAARAGRRAGPARDAGGVPARGPARCCSAWTASGWASTCAAKR